MVEICDMKSAILYALPGLSSMKVEEVLAHLTSLGFSEMNDLKYLECEKDLATILLPLERRKLAGRIMDLFPTVQGKVIL